MEEKTLTVLESLAAMPVDEIAAELKALAPERVTAFKEAVELAVNLEAFSEDQFKGLRIALLALATAKCREAFMPIVGLAKSRAFEAVDEYDWMMYNLYRILSSVASDEDYAGLLEYAVDENICRNVREQFVMLIISGWSAKKLSDSTVTGMFAGIVRASMDKGLFEKDILSAILINAAMIGSREANEVENMIFASNILGDETDRMKKAVKAVSEQREYFHKMMLTQQKGEFTDPAAELESIHEKIVEEKQELPGKGQPIVRESPKIGRNDPCPCGSGKKYKKCCGRDL